jgi:hypothetical protein
MKPSMTCNRPDAATAEPVGDGAHHQRPDQKPGGHHAKVGGNRIAPHACHVAQPWPRPQGVDADLAPRRQGNQRRHAPEDGSV